MILITKDISTKAESFSKTFEEIFVDISTTALLAFVVLYTFFFSSSERSFLGRLAVFVILIITISHLYDKIVQKIRNILGNKKTSVDSIASASWECNLFGFPKHWRHGSIAWIFGFHSIALRG
ncbi:hypothetical protein [Thermococcus sp.]